MLFKRKVMSLNPLLVEKRERIFYIENIAEGDVVFDVGANIGELTMLFSRFVGNNGQVHAFEPTPTTFQKLASIMRSAGKNNVKLNNLAVDYNSGFIKFNTYSDTHASWNTIAKRPLESYGVYIDAPVSVELPAISIDDYCAANSIDHIDLLKIDVEGAELSVLKGAKRMFQERKVRLCVFEFGQTIYDMGNSADELMDFFNGYNYSVENIVSDQYIFPVDKKNKIAHFSIHFSKPK